MIRVVDPGDDLANGAFFSDFEFPPSPTSIGEAMCRDIKIGKRWLGRGCRLAILLSWGFCLLAMPAAAIPVSYNESVDGDLQNQMFIFDLGANVFQGNEHFATSPLSVDTDDLVFTIQDGQGLQSIVFVFDLETTGSVSSAEAGFIIPMFPLPALEDVVQLVGASNANLFVADLPLESGTYQFLKSFNAVIDIGEGFAYDYSLTFNVGSLVAVPEPATWVLFAAGLAGLGWMSRRRKSAWHDGRRRRGIGNCSTTGRPATGGELLSNPVSAAGSTIDTRTRRNRRTLPCHRSRVFRTGLSNTPASRGLGGWLKDQALLFLRFHRLKS